MSASERTYDATIYPNDLGGLHWFRIGRLRFGVVDHRRWKPFSRCGQGYHPRHVGPWCLRWRVSPK